jgi:stage V sporulation protein AA
MDIYIKPAKKVVLSGEGRKSVTVADVAEVSAPAEILPKIKIIKLFSPDTSKQAVKKNKQQIHLISITDIINAVNAEFPNAVINNVGEPDTIVDFLPRPKKDYPAWRWTKTVIIAFILLAGSATAIMSFHADAQLPEVFGNIYYIIFRERVDNPLIIEIPYAIGVAVGITAFYNHIFGKKLTQDPTPIQVEMSLYDTDVNNAVIDRLNVKKTNEEQGKRR